MNLIWKKHCNCTKENQAYERVFDSTSTYFKAMVYISIFNLVMLLIPIVALVIYSQGSYTVEDLSSIIYEEAAPIWFVLILQWCMSIDFDSKFYMQVMTYPIARWKFLLERFLFSTVIFIGLLSVVTISFDTSCREFLFGKV